MNWAKSFAYFGCVLIVWRVLNMVAGRDPSSAMDILAGVQSLAIAASIAAADWAWGKWGKGND